MWIHDLPGVFVPWWFAFLIFEPRSECGILEARDFASLSREGKLWIDDSINLRLYFFRLVVPL
ncbi:MAG: hypothetical protein C4520_14040 [Candidatus Abyssobacteria bacterium SURF_5]|uniref:Uncharacterized protein n=1 Tax=Abyssobacteria bacterium (strain SURF_5) TaxID=2093360 RepID=A0A3A4NT15_ABYX5|nr:MAG: hypothetical protein C4520_14040 [Candidatus Abyssubacteria bacterium SURF_5]